MSSKISVIDARIAPGSTPKPRFLDGIAKRALLRRLQQVRDGKLVLRDGKERLHFGVLTPRCPRQITIQINDPRFYSDIAFGGSIGAGEAYMAGYWHTDDLTGLVRLLLCNRHVLDGMEGGFAALTIPLQKIAALVEPQYTGR